MRILKLLFNDLSGPLNPQKCLAFEANMCW